MPEEAGDAYRGHADGSPGEEIAAIVEWREEGDAEAPVRHGVEEAVTGGGEKEIDPEGEAADRRLRDYSRHRGISYIRSK
jgi:hypothetical protein